MKLSNLLSLFSHLKELHGDINFGLTTQDSIDGDTVFLDFKEPVFVVVNHPENESERILTVEKEVPR